MIWPELDEALEITKIIILPLIAFALFWFVTSTIVDFFIEQNTPKPEHKKVIIVHEKFKPQPPHPYM